MTRINRKFVAKAGWLFSAISFMTIVPSGWAQDVPPFFGEGGIVFDPEIDVVNSGALLDAQVVVSEDRRYVTINARPSLSRLQSLSVFPFTGFTNGGGGGGGAGGGGAQLGFVGGAGYLDEEPLPVEPGMPQPKESAAAAERRHGKKPGPVPKNPVSNSPSQILKVDPTASTSVLRQEGMFKITLGK